MKLIKTSLTFAATGAIALATAAGVGAFAGASGYDFGNGSGDGTGGVGPIPPEPTRGSPCLGPDRAMLLCPDLRMAPPSDLYIDSQPGRVLLHAANNIMSRGRGPIEVRGFRTSPGVMRANQRIHRVGGGVLSIRTTGHLIFKYIPYQYGYWKFEDAANFELWRAGRDGKPFRLERTGPKQVYCLRDLELTAPGFPRAPQSRRYPGCSQDINRRTVTLGTSVGWSDIYPATYHENWINVTGLRGCYFFFHIGDPKNHIRESNERNNRGWVKVRLPSGQPVASCRR